MLALRELACNVSVSVVYLFLLFSYLIISEYFQLVIMTSGPGLFLPVFELL